jgi:plasmid stabilization system protein ParE
MTRRLIVRPDVDADVLAAEAWYRQQSETAAGFPEDVRRTLRLIESNPYQYQTIFGRYRRAVLRRFPYALIYAVTETEIVMVACIHGRRHPRRWQERVPE